MKDIKKVNAKEPDMKELDKKELDSVNGGRRGKYSAEE